MEANLPFNRSVAVCRRDHERDRLGLDAFDGDVVNGKMSGRALGHVDRQTGPADVGGQNAGDRAQRPVSILRLPFRTGVEGCDPLAFGVVQLKGHMGAVSALGFQPLGLHEGRQPHRVPLAQPRYVLHGGRQLRGRPGRRPYETAGAVVPAVLLDAEAVRKTPRLGRGVFERGVAYGHHLAERPHRSN